MENLALKGIVFRLWDRGKALFATACDWLRGHVAPFMVSPMTLEEKALLRRVSTIFQMSIAITLCLVAGPGQWVSVVMLTLLLLTGLFVVSTWLRQNGSGLVEGH